jgi:hypothetical protein
MLVDPLEVAEQAQVGSGEFGCGWWDIRTTLAARQWVELLEGRCPRVGASVSGGRVGIASRLMSRLRS